MNEMRLQDMVVSEAQTDDEKLYYLGIGLEALRGTFFRQTMFAEFELKINEEVEAGNVLTGNTIVTHHTIEDAKSNIANEPQNINGSILIVEDNITNQIIAKKLMVSMGLTVDIVNNGQEGVEAYNSKNYDLIFMDCRMPVMDGYEATEAIRDIKQEKGLTPTPIIALTANVSSDDRILCEESGMNAVVTKPFKRADLSKALIGWLQTGACKIDPTPVLRTFN
ncbi:MAG: CheY-like chemotaxis protein [Flavobacterium sp.]|jgi:CheY-like chemotaxis protein